MNNFSLVKSYIRVVEMFNAITAQPELWNEITARQTTPGSPHKYTEAIFLRWSEDQSLKAVFNDLTCIDYPAMAKLQAQPLINDILEAVGSYELGRVMIAKLSPGGLITPHADEGLYADSYERFHLPIKSFQGNFFIAGNEAVEMDAGELWWFNHKKTHVVYNGSETDRIHLIVDCVAPNYRKERE